MIRDEDRANIEAVRDALRRGPGTQGLAPLRLLEERIAYLGDIFLGVAALKRCEAHTRLPMTPEEYDFVVAPRCEVCLANDLRAMVAGNPEATTLAERYREQSARNLALAIENERLKRPEGREGAR